MGNYILNRYKMRKAFNIIENMNQVIRKYTKTKNMLPNDRAVEKVVYLSLMQVSKKWTISQRDWSIMLWRNINIFGEKRHEVKSSSLHSLS